MIQNRVKNIGYLQYITCKFIKYFNKFLFIGGYWIFILIVLYQKNHEIQSYLQQIVLILNIIASVIILLYSFFVTYVGLPEFRKYSQKSFQTSFFLLFQLKSLLPFCFYVFLSFSPLKEILYILMNICLQYFVCRQIIKKPFFEEKANRLFFCVTFLQTLFQIVLCLHKIFLKKQFALYNRPLCIILIPILIKLLILFHQKYTKISKKQIFEYFNTNNIKHTLDSQINKPCIFQIIFFAKNHIQNCHKIECLCKSINSIKNAQNNIIQKYPIELKCPLLYSSLLKHLAINEYLASKNFDDIWFFCSRIGLFFLQKQRAIDQCKYFMHQYQNFRDLYNKAKFYYCIQNISQDFEKKILKNDIKKIDVHKIIKNEKLIIQLKIQIQKYIEIYNQLIYQSQKQIIDIYVIKYLNEQIYDQYKSYYEIYIKVRKNKKVQKLHELFFENFVLINQKNISKIRLNDNTFFQQEYTKYNFQNNTYYITVSVSAQNLGIINQTSSNIEDCFGIDKKNIIGQSINITFEEKFWKQHDQYLKRYVNDSLRNFSLSKHQVFFKHQQGYAFQCSLQQKAYFCTQNNEFMFFVLLRQQNIQQQVILIDELGYIINYTRNFFNKFPIPKEAQQNHKINILQLIPQSLEWLIDTFLQIKKTMLQQAQNQMFTFQLRKSDGNRSYVHSMVFNDINYKKEQYIDFKGFFEKIMQKIQENNKEEIKKKIQTKMSHQKKFFVQKYLILYDIKTKTAKNLHITQISIKDKKEINLRKAITSNKVFQLFYKITVLRLFVLKWQKLRRLKQVKFFKIQLSLQQGQKEGKNLTKLYVTNSKHGTKELKIADQNQIQISERQNQDQSILKDILEKNRYIIEFRFLMLFTILLFCTVPVFYSYIYYKDDKTIENLIKIQQQDLLKLQLQNYLQISLFLQKNYTFFDTIRQTIKEKILKQFEIFFKSYIDKKNLTSLQINSTLKKSIKTNQLEFFASTYTQTIYYERYQIRKIHQNLDQLLEISELKQDNVFEAVFLQIKLQYFSLLFCVCIQTLLVFTLCFITKKVNQFINQIYKFSTLIKKDKKQFQAIQNFCRLNQLEVQNIDLLKNGHENNVRLTKYKNFRISYIPLISVVVLLYLLSFCYFVNQYRQYDNLLSEVQKIQISKKNLLETSTRILQIYKNDEFESYEKLQALIDNYDLTIQTFNNYMDNNDDFYQSVSRFKIPVVLKYQIRQTMRSTVYFQRKYRYIYNINEIMLKNYLNLDLNQKTEQFLTLEQLVYLLVMRDLFYDNIDIIIKPVQQKLQQSFGRLSLWLNFINIIVLILFWIKFVNKIYKQINISFYIMKFIDKQKFYTNSQLKLFASRLSSY